MTKRFRALLAAAIALVALAVSVPADAQIFRFGPKLGVNINKFSFSRDAFTDEDNRAGFTGGLMAEINVPIIGVGLDVSAMYVRRSGTWLANNEIQKNNRDYFEIPINLKWKINIPVINHIARPFVTTGPSFAFLTSKSNVSQFFSNKKCDVAWNLGAGVELVKHLQVAASYGWGLSKSVSALVPGPMEGGERIPGKNRYWTVTAAWLF